MGWRDDPVVAPAPGGWESDPVVEAAPVDSYAPPPETPVVDPLNPYAPPTMVETEFTEPAERQLTGAEIGHYTVQAGGRALADLAGAVYDIPNAAFMGGQWLANEADSLLTGAPDTPVTGLGEALGGLFGGETNIPPASLSDAIAETSSDVFTALGAPPTAPEDMAGFEPFYDPIRFGLGAAAGGASLATRAPALTERIAAGAPARMGDDLIKPYIDSPGLAISRDAAAGFGAGAGANMSPDEGPMAFLGPLLGALAGSAGFGTALAGGRAVERGVRSAMAPRNYDPVTGEAPSWGEILQAARSLQDHAVDPMTGAPRAAEAADSIGTRAAEFSDAGLPTPTAGLVSDNLGLQGLEHDLRVRNKLPFMQNDNNMRDAATTHIGQLLDPEADQGAVGRAAEGARLERLAPFTQGVEQAQGAADDIAAGLTQEGNRYEPFRSRPDHYQTEASRNLDDVIVNEAYIPARTRKNELYDNIDPDRSEFVSIEPLRGRLQQLRNQINEFGPEALQMPTDFVGRIQGILNRAAPDEDMTASVGELAGLRKFISTARSNARRGGNMDLADNLGAIQTQIDDIIGDHPAAAEANRNYRDNFAPTFRPGPGDEAAKFTQQIDREPFDAEGNPTRTQTPPERTGDRFLRAPEKAAAVDRMIQAAPDPARGRAAVRDYFMSDFAGSVFNTDGSINPNRAANWLQQNEPTLGQFPDLLRDFEQRVAGARNLRGAADEADEALDTARTRLEQEGRNVERGAIGTLLNEDPRDVAKNLLTGQKYSAGRSLDEIEEIIGDDETARRGWRAAVAEVMSDMVSGTVRVTDTDQFRVETGRLDAMMKRHEDDLARVFDEDDMNILRQGHALVEVLKNIPKSAVGGSNTADKFQAYWRALEAGLKARYGVLKGGGVLRTIRIAVESLPNNQQSVQRLVERAYFDPDLMQYLLTTKLPNMSAGESNKYVRGLLATYVGANEGDNPPEEE